MEQQWSAYIFAQSALKALFTKIGSENMRVHSVLPHPIPPLQRNNMFEPQGLCLQFEQPVL